MQRFFSILVTALTATGCLCTGATAQAQSPSLNGPCHVSLFGTILQHFDNRREFTLNLSGNTGTIPVYAKDVRWHRDGLTLRNGLFAGVYGCFTDYGRAFHAEEVTLARSARYYPTAQRTPVVATGRTDEIGAGWIGVRTRYYGHVHVRTRQRNIRVGQVVSIRGWYNPVTRQIEATSISII